MLLQTNDEYHYCAQEYHYKFSLPMKSLLLWERFERDCPLVSPYQCRPVLQFWEWRMAMARLISCTAFYSWLVDFGLATNRFHNVLFQVVPNALVTYNFGLVMGVLFLCAPTTVRN